MASSTIKMLLNLNELIRNIGQLISISNLNDLPINTICWVNVTTTNTPDGSSNYPGHYITIFPLSSHGFQIAIRYDIRDMYIRTYVNGTWNAWHKITIS